MKLHEIPKGSRINCECDDKSKYITFNHLDGMFSNCITEKGNTCHLSASQELEKDRANYKINIKYGKKTKRGLRC